MHECIVYRVDAVGFLNLVDKNQHRKFIAGTLRKGAQTQIYRRRKNVPPRTVERDSAIQFLLILRDGLFSSSDCVRIKRIPIR